MGGAPTPKWYPQTLVSKSARETDRTSRHALLP